MSDSVKLTLNGSEGKIDAVIDWDAATVNGKPFAEVEEFSEDSKYTLEYHGLFIFFERAVCGSNEDGLDSGFTETAIYALHKFGHNWDVRNALTDRVIEVGRKLNDWDAFTLVDKKPEDILTAREKDVESAKSCISSLEKQLEKARKELGEAESALEAAPTEIKELNATQPVLGI